MTERPVLGVGQRLFPGDRTESFLLAEDKTDAVVQSGTALVDHLRENGVYSSFETRRQLDRQGVGKLGEFPCVDAIVMGAYHHSRLNEIVGGGVTMTIIGQPPYWVMVSH